VESKKVDMQPWAWIICGSPTVFYWTRWP